MLNDINECLMRLDSYYYRFNNNPELAKKAEEIISVIKALKEYIDIENTEDWIDVTNSGDYTINDSTVNWSLSLREWNVCTLCDNDIYTEEIELLPYKNHLLHHLEVDISGTDVTEVFIKGDLNLNHYRIWLNGKALIRNVDFKIHRDKIYIVNKEFFDSSTKKQSILIIADGILLDSWYDDQGYVRNGIISFNQRYDYYDDRLLRVVLGGKVFHIDYLLTAEENILNDISVRNGSPYVVENITPALKDENINFDKLLQEALSKEEEIRDYLTLKIPIEPDDSLDPIPDYYLLYSPVISILIYEMNMGRIYIPDGRVTDADIDVIMNPYKYLIEFDPATWELNYDYISVHPHPYRYTLTVTQREFMVLERVNEIYLNNVADLTPFLQVTPD